MELYPTNKQFLCQDSIDTTKKMAYMFSGTTKLVQYFLGRYCWYCVGRTLARFCRACIVKQYVKGKRQEIALFLLFFECLKSGLLQGFSKSNNFNFHLSRWLQPKCSGNPSMHVFYGLVSDRSDGSAKVGLQKYKTNTNVSQWKEYQK